MNDIIIKWNNEQFSLFNSDDFVVQNIENLTWAQNELSLTTSSYLPGDTVQNNVGTARDITITLKPTKGKGDYNDIIHKLARMHGKEVTLVWKNRVIPSYFYDVYQEHTEENLIAPLETDLIITGIVNEFESQRFEDSVIITLNVHCSNPYWTTQEPISSTVVSSLDEGTFNNYSELPTGIKIEIPDFQFSSTDPNVSYYQLFILNGENADFGTGYEIDFFPLPGYSNASGTVNFWATFEKGKISLKRGTTESTATNISAKVGWKVLKAEKISPGTYVGYEVTEFPCMPLSVTQDQLTFSLNATNAGSSTQVTISHYPMFI